MANLTIEIPDALAELGSLDTPLTADTVEMADLIVWNVQARAEAIVDWAEGGKRDAAELERLSGELATLLQTFLQTFRATSRCLD